MRLVIFIENYFFQQNLKFHGPFIPRYQDIFMRKFHLCWTDSFINAAKTGAATYAIYSIFRKIDILLDSQQMGLTRRKY